MEQVDRTAKHGTSYEQGKLAGDIVANVLPFAAGGKKAVTGVKSLSKLEMFTNNIRTSKIADRTVTIGNDVWKKGAAVRGNMIDDALGNNLGHNFPVIDKLENGVITRIKSMDLNAPSYQTAKGVYNKLRRDMDELDNFRRKNWNGKKVNENDYWSKKLEIAIQDMKITAEQRSGIEMVREYAKEKGIEITITVVK